MVETVTEWVNVFLDENIKMYKCRLSPTNRKMELLGKVNLPIFMGVNTNLVYRFKFLWFTKISRENILTCLKQFAGLTFDFCRYLNKGNDILF